MWDKCGMARNAAGLEEALGRIRDLRDRYWQDVRIPGDAAGLNNALEHAGRVADFFELAELMCLDALHRNESCGGHFREEYQTAEGEAKRNDSDYCYVGAWEVDANTSSSGSPAWTLHKEPLMFENVKLAERSYK
jgi:succinate dehydrogenase / fumarate reductase flavoprotein subunit